MVNSRYLFAAIPSLLCVFGNLYGGFSTGLNIFYSMLLLPFAEWFISDNTHRNEGNEANLLPTIVLIILSALHLTVTISLIYGIAIHNLTSVYIIIAAISSGINAGTNGIVVAHELIHRKSFFLRALGILNLIQVNYGHFYIEHIKGHHKYVGTQADPATAKYGESLYKFIFRTIPGQFLSAFLLENKRLLDKNFSPLRNFVVIITIVQLLILSMLYLIFGVKIMIAYLIYSVVAVLLLEYVNYIEHYGLERDDDKKFAAHHAWQSNKLSSRLGLIELSRHADHHLKASKPYHTLNSHPGYFLPSGYFGMFYIALVPFLWFKMINPIIDANKHKFN
jgi:alkane 1-monooxygenase